MAGWTNLDDRGIAEDTRVRIAPDGQFEKIQHFGQVVSLKENEFQKLNDPANGFSEGRHFRKIASIPLVAELDAKSKGYDLSDRKDLERYLAEHPEYQTVEFLDSKRDPRIIIK